MTANDAVATERVVAGRYRLRDRLGRGGMGTVWLAEDELLQRQVAVKEVLLPPTVSDEERQNLRERTMREARAAARLDHPAAVRVFDVVEEDDRPYIVMELLQGQTLGDCVRDSGALPPARVADIGLQLLDALDAAHGAGIVHRDVKPGNVVCRPDGRITLTDFGIASTAGDPSITSTGLLLGSPAYIAPERARGDRPEPPSDMWSLGATLYTAVEGRPPFDKGDAVATLTAVVVDSHAPFELAGPLEEVLHALLAKDPADRPDAARTRELLLRALEQARTQAPRRPPAPAPDARTGSHTVVLSPYPHAPDDGAEAEATAAPAAAPAATHEAPPAATPAPAPDAAAARGRRTRVWGLVVLAVLVFVVTAGIAALVSRSVDKTVKTPGVAGTSTSPSARASGSTAKVPASWVAHDGPSDSRLATPAGWTSSTKSVRGDSVREWDAPAGGRYVRVQAIGAHSDSTRQEIASSRAAMTADYPSLRTISTTDLTWHGWPATQWEFTYSDGGAQLHAVDIIAFAPSGAFGVIYQSHDDEWAKRAAERQSILSSFSAR